MKLVSLLVALALLGAGCVTPRASSVSSAELDSKRAEIAGLVELIDQYTRNLNRMQQKLFELPYNPVDEVRARHAREEYQSVAQARDLEQAMVILRRTVDQLSKQTTRLQDRLGIAHSPY